MTGQRITARPDDDPIRRRRIQADAARPLGVNLAEAIALSHKLLQISGSARRR
ncbi:MAG: hypothetical protein M3383_08170 [Actinomycetota bacterium]|nr:hypothetical protein [Actinomycetota bacterium]